MSPTEAILMGQVINKVRILNPIVRIKKFGELYKTAVNPDKISKTTNYNNLIIGHLSNLL